MGPWAWRPSGSRECPSRPAPGKACAQRMGRHLRSPGHWADELP